MISLFFSYSHRDENLRNELEIHLAMLKRQGVIQTWHDRRIPAGNEIDSSISEHLEHAQVILLLVSPYFLASDYCYDIEMTRALEKHREGSACVIPVILHPCDWQGAPFKGLRATPTDGKPISMFANQHEAFAIITKDIRDVIVQVHPTVRDEQFRRFPRELPPIWNIPYLPNPHFTGRGDLLAALQSALTAGQPAALTQALSGLGGVGKTQLAVQYAYEHTAAYNVIWWVQAEKPATLAADYARLAEPLQLPEHTASEREVVVDAVRRWFGHNTNWLLVFDNARDPADIHAYLPQGATGHVLITSRNPNWGRMARPLPVSVFKRAESVTFLKQRTRQTDKAEADALANALGDLPLALEQAAAYIEATGITLAVYLDRFTTFRQELLQRGVPVPDYAGTVATTWELAFQEVQNTSPAGADLLHLFAFLAPDSIPRDLLQDNRQHLPEALAATAGSPLAFDDALAALRRYSLLEVAAAAFTVHRLVQAVTRDRLAVDARRTWAKAAVRLMVGAYPSGNDPEDVRMWPTCARLMPHALAAAEHAEALQVDADATGELLDQMGLHLRARGQFGQARAVHERALAITEATYGPDHPTVATRLNNLGGVLQALGNLAEAKAHFERALTIAEVAYGPNDAKVALYHSNLGLVLRFQGDLPGAKTHYERALSIAEAIYGSTHREMALYYLNLGNVLRMLGDFAGAQTALERALAIDEAAYGPDHPEVAIDISNLGHVLYAEGDLEGARTRYERALEITEAAYDHDHPTVATRLHNLGLVLHSQGDQAGARVTLERALRIRLACFGENHRDTQAVQRSLAALVEGSDTS